MDKSAQIAYFDERAETWDEICSHNPDKLRTLVTLCGIAPGARVLDVGCGTGVLTPYLLERQPKQVVGVDFSPRMIALAKQKCDDARVEYRCQDVMELSDGEFDLAVVYSAFPHSENRGSLIRQLRHLLLPGGRVMICHSQGRSEINALHQGSAPGLSMPLPAAQTLAHTLAPCFDVDLAVDTPALYAVSGVSCML